MHKKRCHDTNKKISFFSRGVLFPYAKLKKQADKFFFCLVALTRSEKMKAPSSAVRKAASIVIAKYPDNPTDAQRRAVTDFMALLSKLFGLARTNPNNQSRDALTRWGQANFRVWVNADFAAASPMRWGPHMWRLMFKCAKRYTHTRRRIFWNWIQSLRYILPCSKCALHFRRMLSASHDKWQSVEKSSHLTRYFQWMRNTVRKRVLKERKKIYFGSKEKGEWHFSKPKNTLISLTRPTGFMGFTGLTRLTRPTGPTRRTGLMGPTSTRTATISIPKGVHRVLKHGF